VGVDVVEVLALAVLIVAVFVAARTWGRGTLVPSLAVVGLAGVQTFWVLGLLPAIGQFGARTWAAIACGMLIVLGGWLAQIGMKRPVPLAILVSLGAAVELLVLSGILRLA